jgi:beta-lactamase regulating signal transducer with metallopeptidase domain
MRRFKLSNEAKRYWKAFGAKCLDNLASVKVWFFILPFIISTIILSILVGYHLDFMREALTAIVKAEHQDKLVPILGQMEIVATMFISWCAFTVSLAGTIIVVRETFKVKKLVALNDEESDNSEHIKEMKV